MVRRAGALKIGMLLFWSSFAVAGLLGVTACSTAGAAPAPRQDEALSATPLFMPATQAGQIDRSGERGVIRTRHAEVDFGALAPGGDPAVGPERIALNLFPDATLVAVRDRIEASGSGYVWVGRVVGAQDGDVMLSVGDGVLIGNARADGAMYQVRFAGPGVHSVSQIDPTAFPPD